MLAWLLLAVPCWAWAATLSVTADKPFYYPGETITLDLSSFVFGACTSGDVDGLIRGDLGWNPALVTDKSITLGSFADSGPGCIVPTPDWYPLNPIAECGGALGYSCVPFHYGTFDGVEFNVPASINLGENTFYWPMGSITFTAVAPGVASFDWTFLDFFDVQGAQPGVSVLIVGGEVFVSGSAQGGSVEIVVDGELVVVLTAGGDTPADVASALAAAVNADVDLQLLGTVALASGNQLVVTSPITSFTSFDPGLQLAAPGGLLSLQKISDVRGYLSAPGSPGSNPGGVLDDIDNFGPATRTGDFDADGRLEFWIGAARDDDGGFNRGAGYVLFLNTDGTVASLQKVSDSSGGLSGAGDPGGLLVDSAQFGNRAAQLGDLDGDGVDDLAVGLYHDAGGGSERGAVYVLRMNADATVKAVSVIDDAAMSGAIEDGDNFGRGLAWLGDLGGPAGMSSVLAVGAFGDDDGGLDLGAVYLLSLSPVGTVESYTKISATVGGFPGGLVSLDQLGRSVERLGDLDDDGQLEIAVGALGGGGGTGSVWILSIDSGGGVASAHEIASHQSGFDQTLDPGDAFGFHLASLGDLDGDGIEDLAVGAFRDDDGGIDRGAVWLLFLDSGGQVHRSSKLSALAPLLSSELEDGDFFGSVAAADVDGNGVTDLLVGSIGDDDGGNARGAAYVLFLRGTAAVCGNGALDPAEECDDGNVLDGDLCSATCSVIVPVCGNGVVEFGEACDDGGTSSGDGCSATCQVEFQLSVAGTAQGGSLSIFVSGGPSINLATTLGMTADQVAQAIADEANLLEPGLATRTGSNVYFTRKVIYADTGDPGITFPGAPVPVPTVGWPGLLALGVMLIAGPIGSHIRSARAEPRE